MEIIINCTTYEYNRIKKYLTGETSVVVNQKKANQTAAMYQRLDFVSENISTPIRKETLYRNLRKKGYSFKRKTFCRDIEKLEENNLVKITLHRDDGFYSMIHKI